MSRTVRPYLRGAAFHITARTNGGAWFQGCEERIERVILEGVASSDAWLMAHAVMPNHFHVVLRQGARPLGWIMQPIMRRIAMCAQRATGRRGHIFERPFRSSLCGDADYVRRAVAYTNMNPHRAGLCGQAGFYPWCSQQRLATGEFARNIDVPFVTRLFARTIDTSPADCLADYLAYIRWRLKRDAAAAAGVDFAEPEPIATGGDIHFQQHFAGLPSALPPILPDLRDHARNFLATIDSSSCLDELRRPYLDRRRSAVRKQLIAALLHAGYRGTALSRFFRVSETTISKIATQIRYAALRNDEGSPQRCGDPSKNHC